MDAARVARIAFEQVIGPYCDGGSPRCHRASITRQSLDLHHSHATELRTTHYNEAMNQVVPSPGHRFYSTLAKSRHLRIARIIHILHNLLGRCRL